MKNGGLPASEGAVVYDVLKKGCRNFLKHHFGVNVCSNLIRVAGPKLPHWEINRQHWDQWAEYTFQQAPKNSNPAEWAGERDKREKAEGGNAKEREGGEEKEEAKEKEKK